MIKMKSYAEIIKDIKQLRLELNGCKGHIGELFTYRKIEVLNDYGVKFLFNLFLPDQHGDKQTREIDILVITNRCLFVIENKSITQHNVTIDESKPWNKKYSGENEQIDNPIQQNKKNIDNLRAIIGNDVLICNLVVFSNNTIFNTVKISSKDTYVMNNGRLYEFIQGYLAEHKDCKVVNVDEIYDKLGQYEKRTFKNEYGRIFGLDGEW